MDETSNKTKLSKDDMWSLLGGKDKSWGIEGYEAPRHYYDYNEVKWEKERAEILKNHQSVWPPKDWPKKKKDDGSTEQTKPIRPNYLDLVYKWSKSFYDEEKAKNIISDLEQKGRPINGGKKEVKKDKKREQFLEHEEEIKKRRAEYSDYPKYDEKIQWIEKAQERIKEFNDKNNKKDHQAEIKEKYAKFGSLPKCDRILFVADAEHVGEKLPFYNTYVKDGDEEQNTDKKNKQHKKLFFPSKTATWTKAPVYSYPKKKHPIKKKEEEASDAENEDKKKFEPIDVRQTFYNMTNKGKVLIEFRKPFDFKSTEQHKTWRQTNTGITPGPQQYWKTLPYNKNKPDGKDDEMLPGTEQGEGKAKVYLMNRKKTDKKIYKPMNKSLF